MASSRLYATKIIHSTSYKRIQKLNICFICREASQQILNKLVHNRLDLQMKSPTHISTITYTQYEKLLGNIGRATRTVITN